MSTHLTHQVPAPPSVGFFRRIFWLLVLVVGFAAVLGAVLGGATLVETYLV
jgi:hypothetical protein